MRFLKETYSEHFDIAIVGLGYESRAITAFNKYRNVTKRFIVLGYNSHQNLLFYQQNKSIYGSLENCDIYEVDDSDIEKLLLPHINELPTQPSVLVDITVMTRHRLSRVINFLVRNLLKNTRITLCYNVSTYVEPPPGVQPVRAVGPILDYLQGSLGSLSYTSTVVFGLGYEKLKALGVYHLLEPDNTVVFIPKSDFSQFKDDVEQNNKELIDVIPESSVYEYDIYNPYDIYVDLKSLILSIQESSRVILVPLGPKILAAVSVLIGIELHPNLPVWRVSSLHEEVPVDREAHTEVLQTIIL